MLGPVASRSLRSRTETEDIMWWKFSTLSKQVKKHPGLVPLLGFTVLGITNATIYLVKTALFNPEISWVKKEEPEPWYK